MDMRLESSSSSFSPLPGDLRWLLELSWSRSGWALSCVRISGFSVRCPQTRPSSLCTAGEARPRQWSLFCPTSWVCYQPGSGLRPGLQRGAPAGSWCVLTRHPPPSRSAWPAPAPSAPWWRATPCWAWRRRGYWAGGPSAACRSRSGPGSSWYLGVACCGSWGEPWKTYHCQDCRNCPCCPWSAAWPTLLPALLGGWSGGSRRWTVIHKMDMRLEWDDINSIWEGLYRR